MIVTPGAIEPGNVISTPQEGLSGTKDQVILDDLIVDGSICVGFDCVNGESFGFDTIRIKENNLRIRAVDTSSTASFPSRDWQITFNDSSNGGANKFSIDDIDGGRTPFTIEAGAPSHSLYVDDGGRLGLGTSTPVVDVHVKSGNTPTLRLEQDGSSGFAPQTWDLAGNETNFFIRDASNGSTLPFRIRPGAPTSAIDIAANGDVGIGTSSPAARLEIKTSGSDQAHLLIKDDSSAGALLEVVDTVNNAAILFSTEGGGGDPVEGKFTARTAGEIYIGSKSDHPVKLVIGNTNVIMTVNSSGNYLDMVGGGTYDGNWNNGSSRELKDNIKSLSADDALETLKGLEPVRYTYKRNKKEEHVGFIAEDVPGLVANNSRKNLSAMDIVAVLTKVVQEQQEMVQEQQKMVQQQQKTIAELKEKVEKLEKDSK
jgi:hypothetical protein